jgi:hypothetical protein
MRNEYKIVDRNLKGGNHLGDLGTDGRVRLKWILEYLAMQYRRYKVEKKSSLFWDIMPCESQSTFQRNISPSSELKGMHPKKKKKT